MKKLKDLIKKHNNRPRSSWNKEVKPKEEDLFQIQLIMMIQEESYLGAFLILQEKLRQQAKENKLIEDKRTEGIN